MTYMSPSVKLDDLNMHCSEMNHPLQTGEINTAVVVVNVIVNSAVVVTSTLLL